MVFEVISFFRHFALTQIHLNLTLLSNDNAFLNTMDNPSRPFNQRTLFSRLGSPNQPIMVVKPIFHLWTLLALQGQDQLLQYQPLPISYSAEDCFTTVASKSENAGSISVLLSSIGHRHGHSGKLAQTKKKSK